MMIDDFYDRLAPFYHLLFPDWQASIDRQGRALDAVIRARLGDGAHTVLDVACGIGTQSLGLAALGHAVTASDLSPGAVARARKEAAARGLEVAFSVADMRHAFDHHGRAFDMVLCADNALPHLPSEAEMLGALRQLFACTRPGGVCLISVRDYAAMRREGAEVQPYGVRDVEGTRFVLLQTRDFEGDSYVLAFYVIEERDDTATTHVLRTRYHAVTIDTLLRLMRAAGFVETERLDDVFFQPLLVGRCPGRGG